MAALVFVAACSGGTVTPTAEPNPTLPSGYSDAQAIALMQDSIDVLWCGSEPVADWCDDLVTDGGKPRLEVQLASLVVHMKTGTSVELARTACKNIAFGSHDDNAKPIGFLGVSVFVDGKPFVGCNAPSA